jgi:hypothetical protein
VTIDRPFVIIGNPQSLRIRQLNEELVAFGQRRFQTLAYADLLGGRCGIGDVPPQSIVRFESPGKDFKVEKLLLMRGAPEAESEGSPGIALSDAKGLEYDRGRIWFPRQWYLGFRHALRTWHAELQTRDDILLTAWPPDIETLFDKCQCHARCREGGISVPQAIEPVSCYDDLVARMEEHQWERVFVKLAHGSSASGALALQRHRGRSTAFTTVDIVAADGEQRLYNTRPPRSTTDEDEIRRLINALAPHRLHAEQWLPKAWLEHGLFDLRIVVIAGRPRHTVVREGRSPITNLQLGNRRGSLTALYNRLPPERWSDLQETCSHVAELHSQSLQLGVDLLLTPGFRRHFLLEVNAFGDWLPRVLHEKQSTFAAELAALALGWPYGSTDVLRLGPNPNRNHPESAVSCGLLKMSQETTRFQENRQRGDRLS